MNSILGTTLLALIVLVLVLILIGLMLLIHRSPPVEFKALEDMAVIMRIKYEEKERERHERELVENARRAMNKNQKPLPMQSSTSQGDRPVRVGSKQNELVPFDLSAVEKKIWEEFNR